MVDFRIFHEVHSLVPSPVSTATGGNLTAADVNSTSVDDKMFQYLFLMYILATCIERHTYLVQEGTSDFF